MRPLRANSGRPNPRPRFSSPLAHSRHPFRRRFDARATSGRIAGALLVVVRSDSRSDGAQGLHSCGGALLVVVRSSSPAMPRIVAGAAGVVGCEGNGADSRWTGEELSRARLGQLGASRYRADLFDLLDEFINHAGSAPVCRNTQWHPEVPAVVACVGDER